MVPSVSGCGPFKVYKISTYQLSVEMEGPEYPVIWTHRYPWICEYNRAISYKGGPSTEGCCKSRLPLYSRKILDFV